MAASPATRCQRRCARDTRSACTPGRGAQGRALARTLVLPWGSTRGGLVGRSVGRSVPWWAHAHVHAHARAACEVRPPRVRVVRWPHHRPRSEATRRMRPAPTLSRWARSRAPRSTRAAAAVAGTAAVPCASSAPSPRAAVAAARPSWRRTGRAALRSPREARRPPRPRWGHRLGRSGRAAARHARWSGSARRAAHPAQGVRQGKRQRRRDEGGEGRAYGVGRGRKRRPSKTSGCAAARLRVQRDEQLVVGLAHLARAVGRECLVHGTQHGQYRLAANGREGSRVGGGTHRCEGHASLVFGQSGRCEGAVVVGGASE